MLKEDVRVEDLLASDPDAPESEQVDEIFSNLKGKSYEWLLITDQSGDGCMGAIHPNRGAVIYELGNALTCHVRVAAVFHQGRKLSEKEVAPLVNEALNGLGPVSRASAEGQLRGCARPMPRQKFKCG